MEIHVLRTDLPTWNTKQRCTCGYESPSKAEQWLHQASERLAIIIQLERDVAEAVDLAEEAIPYASEYLREKWDLDGRCARLKAKIDPQSEAFKEFWVSP